MRFPAPLALPLVLLLALVGCERERPQELGPPPAVTAEPAAAAPVDSPPASTASSRIAPAAIEAAGVIAGDDIRRVVAEIADDRYAGRAPGTPGDKRARAYLAAELDALGFEPGAGNGSYEQPVELVGVTSTPPAKWRF
ncbi:MAG TPA: hypothetical protein VFJ95_12745, partial [Gammaproteobacteria bacterium]|nr:hypothetical protein [Gammaproteobacteria bacterium]